VNLGWINVNQFNRKDNKMIILFSEPTLTYYCVTYEYLPRRRT
jgi:hypothetical protein